MGSGKNAAMNENVLKTEWVKIKDYKHYELDTFPAGFITYFVTVTFRKVGWPLTYFVLRAKLFCHNYCYFNYC